MRKRLGLALLVVGLVGLTLALPVTGAVAQNDPDPCNGYLVSPDVRGVIVPIVDPNTGPYYLDVRDFGQLGLFPEDKFLYSIWLYQESNGEPGLQRGSCSAFFCSIDPASFQDPCVESGNPDQDIF